MLGKRLHQRLFWIFLPLSYLLLTQNWMSWSDGLRYLHADDTRSYLAIANAAPSFALHGIPFHHAQRFAVHYLAGCVAHFGGIPLPFAYGILLTALIVAILWVVDRIFLRLKLSRLK